MSKRMKIWLSVAIAVSILLTVIIMAGVIFCLVFLWQLPNPPVQDPPLEYYYEQLQDLQETTDSLTVGDVFEFEFDEAYVYEHPYGDEALFLKELNVETAVPLFQWDSGRHFRIFFIKDRCIIYDFVYDTMQINTAKKGITIYPDTPLTLTEKQFSNGEPYLQMAFYNFRKDGRLEYSIQSDQVYIDYVNYTREAIDIPSQLDGLPVTRIGEMAFYQNACTSVTLPDTLVALDDHAFYRCHQLRQITLPAATVSVGSNPFFRCSSLESIHVEPGNPNYCDIDGVLYDAAVTTLIAYPEGRTETLLEIPEGVTSIAEEAFGYSSGLQQVIIPPSVTDFPEGNPFELYEQVSLTVTAGSAAEEYAIRQRIPYQTTEH